MGIPRMRIATDVLAEIKVLEYLARGDENGKTPTGEIRRVEL